MTGLEDCLMAVLWTDEEGEKHCPILDTKSGTCNDCYQYLENGLIYREEDR